MHGGEVADRAVEEVTTSGPAVARLATDKPVDAKALAAITEGLCMSGRWVRG
jgi:hypothetical protein